MVDLFAKVGGGCLGVLIVLTIFTGLVAGFSALSGLIFMLLWNFAVVEVFQAPPIDFLHAWGLWFLVVLVTGAFRSSNTRRRSDDK